MLLAIIAVVIGLIVLVWSADKFIDGAAALAKLLGMPSFLIGVVIIGFGTSAPEMVVSVLSAMAGSPGIALGNAYGSNITNIALILGLTAIVSPILIRKNVVKRDLPLLLLVTVVAAWQLFDAHLSRFDGIVLLSLLIALLGFNIYQSLKHPSTDELVEKDNIAHTHTQAVIALLLGLVLLVVSSRSIVWGAIQLASYFGISDLIIGLTVVAIGTSLPELVASIVAAKRGEHDMAVGNIIGSNLFNTLAVVGLAAVIHPMAVEPMVLKRDMAVVATLTFILLLFCLPAFKYKAHIGRAMGATLVLAYAGYTLYLINCALHSLSVIP